MIWTPERERVLGLTESFGQLQRVRTWDPFSGGFQPDPASGILLPERVSGRLYPTAVDLFAGAGGFSLGFHQAGFHVVGALEIWPTAATTYLANLGSPATRIYVQPKLREGWLKEFQQARKRDGKKPRKGWNGPDGPAQAEPVPWEGRQLHDHGEFFTWEGAGTGWIAKVRERPLNRHDPEATYVETVNGREPGACYEPAEAMFIWDAKEIDGQEILDRLGMAVGELDAICGGPPCQGFSTAGRRNVYDERNSLIFDFARLVCEMRPKSMVMENVPGILSMVTDQGELVVDALTRILEEGGMGARDNLRQMLETTAGVGVAHRGTRRHKEEKLDGETRAERRKRLHAERKAIKKETARTVAKAKSGEVLIQDDLFGDAA